MTFALCGALSFGCAEQPSAQNLPPPVAQRADGLITRAEAARFLSQATFGPTQAELDAFTTREAWVSAQLTQAAPTMIDQVPPPQYGKAPSGDSTFQYAFLTNAVTGQGQLRQRVAFALSEIFVVSFKGPKLASRPAGMASYHDMLAFRAFGPFRGLLDDVTLHPMMGQYLSMLKNDGVSGSPDENYAREVMQLFTIGLYELELDGTPKQPLVESYTQDDVRKLAHVLSGWSWACLDGADPEACWNGAPAATPAEREVLPMQANASHHSTQSVTLFEGKPWAKVIAGTKTPQAALRLALDALEGHPNVGPFIGKQLIQRLVTSNPSPGYVSRVATAYNTGSYVKSGRTFGNGTRGHLRAVVAAVLLDDEAQGATQRLREPVLRLTAALRAFGAGTDYPADQKLRVADLEDSDSLGQMPYRSPSVFNFFRPGYSPRNTEIGQQGLLAPEFQITNEVSTAGYANLMLRVVRDGVPVEPSPDGARWPVKLRYQGFSDTDTDQQIVDRVALTLTSDRMDATMRARLLDTIGRVTDPQQKRQLATYLTLVSPDFLIQ